MSGYRAKGALCAIVLTYVRPLEEVDALMDAHVAWLERGFVDGTLLVAGRQDPRTGGVIVAQGTRTAIEACVADDPFIVGGVAEAQVIAFHASFAQPAIAALIA